MLCDFLKKYWKDHLTKNVNDRGESYEHFLWYLCYVICSLWNNCLSLVISHRTETIL